MTRAYCRTNAVLLPPCSVCRAIKAKRTRDPALPPLEFDRFFQPMGCMRHNRFISKLCWLRKQLVYAIATVHSGNGQYRALQVGAACAGSILVWAAYAW